MPVTLPPGRAKLATKPVQDRVAADVEDDRYRRGRIFRSACRSGATARHDHVDLATDEIRRQSGQSIIAALRPAVFDRQVLSHNIPGFAQSLAERGDKRCIRAGRCAASAKVADHRHWLLRACHMRATRPWPRPVLRTRAVSCAPPRFGRKYDLTRRVGLCRAIGSRFDIRAGAAEPSFDTSPRSRPRWQTWFGWPGRCWRRIAGWVTASVAGGRDGRRRA